jgi:hypothetical protein
MVQTFEYLSAFYGFSRKADQKRGFKGLPGFPKADQFAGEGFFQKRGFKGLLGFPESRPIRWTSLEWGFSKSEGLRDCQVPYAKSLKGVMIDIYFL